MNHPPNDLACKDYARDGVTNPMDGYLCNAHDAVKAWAAGPTTNAGSRLTAAYMQGCALLHAAEWLVDAIDCRTTVLDRISASLSLIGPAIDRHGEAISAAIEVSAESIDRLADATENADPLTNDLAAWDALIERVVAYRKAQRQAGDAAGDQPSGADKQP
jgi:hypothetical protein